MRNRSLFILPMAALVSLASGCGNSEGVATTQPTAATTEAVAAPTNRIDVPAAVRQNLGITFAKVERRQVSSTLRVPGRFELLPSARREHRTTLPGWIRLLVAQYDEVKAGTPISQLDSPEWHRLRKQLHESQATIEAATAELAVAVSAKAEAEALVKALGQRVSALAGAEVRRGELDAEFAAKRAAVPRLDAEIRVKQAKLKEAKHDFGLEVDAAASLLGLSPKFLTETADPASAGEEHDDHSDEHKVQRWYAISKIEMTADSPGVVETLHVTNGAWADENTVIATVINPDALRFKAIGLQSDLGRLKNGLPVAVVPPQGSGIEPTDVLPGVLKVGLGGDPDQRTIDLMASPTKLSNWARPGVSALLEITVDGSGKEELSIPLSAVVRDELTQIYFRRDPKNPDKVIRVEADLGANDGKWVVVNSGLKAGDEVVLDGVYELKLSGGGRQTGGGHFHADGSWHAEPDK